MLRSILGSKSREQVILFLASNAEGYITEIVRFSGMDLYSIQKQLTNLEMSGVVISRQNGRKRIYAFNPDYPLLKELKQLVEKSITYQVEDQPGRVHGYLPSWLSSFFWDHPFHELSWESDRDLIVRRLLTEGSWKAVVWLRKHLGDDGLRDWLIAHRGRGLSPRQISYWALVLDLPHRQVASWIRTSRNSAWSQR